MKLLFKHCDILAADGEGYRWIQDGYLGIDGRYHRLYRQRKARGPL